MIAEENLATLSYPVMPQMVSNAFPGRRAQEVIQRALQFQSPTRPSVRGRIVVESGYGAGIQDPDGNILLDLSAGVAVSNVGRNHPRVVAAIRDQSERLMHSAGLVNETTVELAERISACMPEGCAANASPGSA